MDIDTVLVIMAILSFGNDLAVAVILWSIVMRLSDLTRLIDRVSRNIIELAKTMERIEWRS